MVEEEPRIGRRGRDIVLQTADYGVRDRMWAVGPGLELREEVALHLSRAIGCERSMSAFRSRPREEQDPMLTPVVHDEVNDVGVRDVLHVLLGKLPLKTPGIVPQPISLRVVLARSGSVFGAQVDSPIGKRTRRHAGALASIRSRLYDMAITRKRGGRAVEESVFCHRLCRSERPVPVWLACKENQQTFCESGARCSGLP